MATTATELLPAGPRTASQTGDDSPLSFEDQARLAACERVILKGFDQFLEVAQSLATIRYLRLYRGTHKSFEAFCAERFDLSKSRTARLITAHEIAGQLDGMEREPRNERVIRPLTSLSSIEDRRKAWALALQSAGTKDPTYRHVADAVRQVSPRAVQPSKRIKGPSTIPSIPTVSVEAMVAKVRKADAGLAWHVTYDAAGARTGVVVVAVDPKMVDDLVEGVQAMREEREGG